jgi:hypothetical protein
MHAEPINKAPNSKEHAMPTTCTSHAVERLPRRFSLLPWISQTRRFPRLDLDGLAEELLRDLGFQDGHISPPRDPLRD